MFLLAPPIQSFLIAKMSDLKKQTLHESDELTVQELQSKESNTKEGPSSETELKNKNQDIKKRAQKKPAEIDVFEKRMQIQLRLVLIGCGVAVILAMSMLSWVYLEKAWRRPIDIRGPLRRTFHDASLENLAHLYETKRQGSREKLDPLSTSSTLQAGKVRSRLSKLTPPPYWAHEWQHEPGIQLAPQANPVAAAQIMSTIVNIVSQPDSWGETNLVIHAILDDKKFENYYEEKDTKADRERPLIDDDTEMSTISPKARILLERLFSETKQPQWATSEVKVVDLGQGQDAGGVQREWMTRVWSFVTDPRLKLFTGGDSGASVYLNPALSHTWQTMLLRLWAKHKHIRESPLPVPNLHGTCLNFLFGGGEDAFGDPDDNNMSLTEDQQINLHGYLLRADPVYSRLVAELDFLARPRLPADGDMFSTAKAVQLIAFMRDRGVIEPKVAESLATTNLRDFASMMDGPTKAFLESVWESAYLYPAREIKRVESCYGHPLLAEEGSALGSTTPYTIDGSACKAFSLHDDFRSKSVRNCLLYPSMNDGYEFLEQNWHSDPDTVLLATDVLRTIAPHILHGYQVWVIRQRRQMLLGPIREMIPPIQWERLASAALTLKPERVKREDLERMLGHNPSCNRFRFTGLAMEDDLSGLSHDEKFPEIGIDAMQRETIDFLAHATEHFEQDPEADTFEWRGTSISRPKCSVSPMEAMVKYFTGSMSPSTRSIMINCTEGAADVDINAHTCYSRIDLYLPNGRAIGQSEDDFREMRLGTDRLINAIMDGACKSVYTSA